MKTLTTSSGSQGLGFSQLASAIGMASSAIKGECPNGNSRVRFMPTRGCKDGTCDMVDDQRGITRWEMIEPQSNQPCTQVMNLSEKQPKDKPEQ